jgi:hypothetical protein
MPIRRHQRSESRSLLVILVNVFFFSAGVLSHLGPNEEMLHRRLYYVKAIEHLMDMPRPDVLLRLFEERALVSRAFWPSHDISIQKTLIVQ